jgi:hypothetical protein
MRIHIPKS